MIIPKYMTQFKCIGGACEDNCCIGWDVDIDKNTYLKYKNVRADYIKAFFNVVDWNEVAKKYEEAIG